MSSTPNPVVSNPPSVQDLPGDVWLQPAEDFWQDVKSSINNWANKQNATTQQAGQAVQKQQEQNDAKAAAKTKLFETNPDEFKKQYPFEYLYRKGYQTVENAVIDPALQGSPSALQNELRPKLENFVETGLSAYGLPKPGTPEPAIKQGVVLPEGGGLGDEAELSTVERNFQNAGVEVREDPIGHWILPNGKGVSTLGSKGIQNHWEAAIDAGYLPESERTNSQVDPRGIVNGLMKKNWVRWTGQGSYEVWGLNDINTPVLEKRLSLFERDPQRTIYVDDAKTGTAYNFKVQDLKDNDFNLPATLRKADRTKYEPSPAQSLSLGLSSKEAEAQGIAGVPKDVRLEKIQPAPRTPRTLEYNDETGRWKNAKGDPVARMDTNALGFMSPDGTVRVAPERTQGFEHSIYEHADMFPNKTAMQQELANGGVRFGRTPGTSRDAYVSIAKTDPETIQRAINVINRLPVDDFFVSVEKPDLSSSVAEFSGTGKEVTRKLNERFSGQTELIYAPTEKIEGVPKNVKLQRIRSKQVKESLPPQPRLPDSGQYAAIQTDDGGKQEHKNE